MKALLLVVAAAATLLGAAGAATLALERRLAGLAPGGVEIDTLHYNPLSGHLRVAGVRAHDADGREIFRAERVAARASPLPLLAGWLTLSRVVVEAPRLTLSSPAALTAGLPRLRIDDVAVTGGHVVVEHAATGPPLRAHDVDLRVGRLTTAPAGQPDLAFACELTAYGTLVRVTGQPRGAGYALHVRAQDLDMARLARELPGRRLAGLRSGRGEVDAVLQLVGGRWLAAGRARVADVVLALPVRGQPRLRAASVMVVADGLDLRSGAGRIARVLVEAPSLALPVATAAPTLAALLEWLRAPEDLRVRRIAVTDGTLALTGAGGVRLERVQVSAGGPERAPADAWALTARAALDRGADVVLDGLLTRDLRALDAAARVRRVRLTPWRGLTGAPVDWDARVSFEGRLRVAARDGAVTLTGQTSVAGEPAGEEGAHVAVHRRVTSADPGSTIRALLVALEDAVHVASAVR